MALTRGLEIARAQQMRPEETRIENSLRELASGWTAVLLRRIRRWLDREQSWKGSSAIGVRPACWIFSIHVK